MPMEKCIWRLSKEQSDWLGLDCCYLAEGKSATLNIINPEKILNVTKEVFEGEIEEFNNYYRLVNRAEGVVETVVVNGGIIFENNNFWKVMGKLRNSASF